MKIDRRSFLSFVVGGAAGTALSPLPWKLTDDLSIWSQNWPWTPDPPKGEAVHVNSTCTLCPGGCGITVRKVDNRAVKIEGSKGHPVNDGGICLLGMSGLQMLYGPTRIQTPLKRIGGRGGGKWQKISWNKALAEVSAKLSDLRTAGKAHTVSAISGSDRGTVANLLSRFLTVYGSPNFIRTPSIRDTYEMTLHLMQGVQASVGFDIENASLILSFGSGIIEGWGSPVRMFRANSRLKKTGGKVIQVETRFSKTAAKSDKWIPIKSGTDAALALGIAHVIIKESRYNKRFVENHGFGFNDRTDSNGTRHKGFKSVVLESFGPEKVSEITGIDKATIAALARTFAQAPKPLAICGRGQGNTPGSVTEFMAVHALNALVGNINKPGGVWAIQEADYIDWPRVEMDALSSAGIQKGRLDDATGDRYPNTLYLLNRFVENLRSGKPYPIEALFVTGANPVYSLPDTMSVKAALDKIPFVVSFSSYMDETTKNADLILPNHTYLERYEDVPQPEGLQKPIISLTRPVVSPQCDTRHLGDVILSLAKALGGTISKAFPWKTYEACLEATLGDTLDVLLAEGYWINDRFTPATWDNAFDTTSSKFEFSVQTQTGTGKKRLLPAFESVQPEGDAGTYPLLLIPYDSMRLANDYVGDTPFMIKTVEDSVLKENDSYVEINPKTARQMKLSEGKAARLETPKGSARVRIHLSETVGPKTIALPRGLGHTAYDGYLAGKGVNVNDLIGPVPDPISGLDAAWGIRARLSKA